MQMAQLGLDHEEAFVHIGCPLKSKCILLFLSWINKIELKLPQMTK